MADIWDVVKSIPLDDRNFDHPNGALPQFALPALEEGQEPREISGQPTEGHVSGSLMAIAELAGYTALTFPCHPDLKANAMYVEAVAQQLEDQARGLRHMLRLRREQREQEEERTNGR
jgi:hypothetical protein